VGGECQGAIAVAMPADIVAQQQDSFLLSIDLKHKPDICQNCDYGAIKMTNHTLSEIKKIIK